jgi:hypothetical protein
MSRSLLKRRLSEVASRLKSLREEQGIVEEQLAALNEDAEEARLRALVSETPIAGREHQEAQRHAEAMAHHLADVVAQVSELERAQDDLLDRLMAEIR